MSVYTHFTTGVDGSRSFVRHNPYNDDGVLFYWTPNGEVKITEYETITPGGELTNEKRWIEYNYDMPDNYRMFNTHHHGWEYAAENHPFLSDSDDTQTYDERNDFIRANGGNDYIDAGDGHNVAFGHEGNDTLIGGFDTDILFGHEDEDTLYGGHRDDYLFGGADDDELYGEEADDVLVGGLGNDFLDGGSGNDIIFDLEGDNVVRGRNGEDYIITGDGDDVINGDHKDDVIFAGGGNDKLRGNDDNDELHGEDGDDAIFGHDGDDWLYGGAGDDSMQGGAGDDVLYGGAGTDWMDGGDGDDILYADDAGDPAADDNIQGGNGDDILYAGSGIDRLHGEDGDDLLIASTEGKSYLSGGNGADTYGFTGLTYPVHWIRNFDAEDAINLTDVLEGFDPATSAIEDFVTLVYRDDTRTDIKVNTDGQGTDFAPLVIVEADLGGVSATDLYNSGQLIVDQSLVV